LGLPEVSGERGLNAQTGGRGGLRAD
jgi:hypothetical protein